MIADDAEFDFNVSGAGGWSRPQRHKRKLYQPTLISTHAPIS